MSHTFLVGLCGGTRHVPSGTAPAEMETAFLSSATAVHIPLSSSMLINVGLLQHMLSSDMKSTLPCDAVMLGARLGCSRGTFTNNGHACHCSPFELNAATRSHGSREAQTLLNQVA